ncbi:PREDICTED: uncharacterized protein LOC104598086 [Nelumbo nucifera]|uniref:Uncharacterized protein LOC104598086 n=2 Tax=Nelumbo nucifera TaxID=4432 RepID=A0A1U8A8K8_NELNU|nr:PREDICTED: uncharacterized protein LOC104598086 [Nelumbo nucifera]DAD31308.1 TPA_asm: hypothetical protein HUJ06_010159 [Nelumbo nucifera]
MRKATRGFVKKPRPKRWPRRWQARRAPHHFTTTNKLKKAQYQYALLHVPSAPLNTTSYIIKAKETNHHPVTSSSPLHNDSDGFHLSSFNGYGSMKGLLGLCQWSEETGESVSSSCQRVEEEEEEEGMMDGLVHWQPQKNSRIILPKLLALRIRKQGDQIAHLEEESLMMKERVMCLERELDGLKHRVKILELTNHAMSVVRVCSCDASSA